MAKRRARTLTPGGMSGRPPGCCDRGPTEGRDPETGQFVQGYKGGGRPKGSRNKLGEKFILDAYAMWQEHGIEALRTMSQTDPSGFCRLIAGVLPDKLEVDVKHNISKIEWTVVDHRPVRDVTPVLPLLDDAKQIASDSNSLDDEAR